ncbi:MAG: SigE family RNA polymerase sigma factor [Stackebrandtia sp.]
MERFTASIYADAEKSVERDLESFDEYVRARSGALLRFAYLLCGDAHLAEDFVQEALIRCHRKWSRIERDYGPDAYVRKTVLRQYLSWRRRKASTEHVTDEFDRHGDLADVSETFGDRDEVWRILARLPRRQRAVLVLRFYEDFPDEQIADLLGCSPATVRVHASRGLARLRYRLHIGEHSEPIRKPSVDSRVVFKELT